MTTPNEVRELIYAQAVTTLTALLTPSSFAFDNEEYSPPSDSTWVRVSVRETVSDQGTLGPVETRRYTRRGAAAFEIYAPTDDGTAEADRVVKAVRDDFEGVSLRDGVKAVHFNDCQVVELGVEGARWRVNALASFWFEDRK